MKESKSWFEKQILIPKGRAKDEVASFAEQNGLDPDNVEILEIEKGVRAELVRFRYFSASECS